MVDPFVALSGLLVGIVVGLTGMGGGALMTPLLVLGFGVPPLAAVSSDLVASVVMKPVGGMVHWRKGTVHKALVGWLVLGSVPAAFLGVWLLRRFASGVELQHVVRSALGFALLVASLGMLARELLLRAAGASQASSSPTPPVKRWQTVLIGIVGGIIVGMTSVGSGSLIMVMLLLLYPHLQLRQLVGTDLVQAIPLVGAAALGHLLFGQFELGLTLSVLIGALPGVYLGARLSSRAPDRLIRPALVMVLVASGLKLLGVDSVVGLVVALMSGVTAFATFGRPVADKAEPAVLPDPAE